MLGFELIFLPCDSLISPSHGNKTELPDVTTTLLGSTLNFNAKKKGEENHILLLH